MSSDRPETRNDRLGFIGLGLLGTALAERALGGGWEVVGYDVEESRRLNLRALGGRPLDSARAVAECCRRLFFVLPDDRVSREVLDEIESAIRPGTIILDATTGDADATAALGQSLAERGVTYLDATVSGSSVQARGGEALLLVGGPREAFDECRELFRLIAGRAIHTGPCGSGAKMKLVTNLVLGLNRAALAEGLVLARTLGLDESLALAVLQASIAYSRTMDTKGEKMIREDFTVQARLSQHLKDVRLMLAAAGRAGRSLPLSEAHCHLLEFAEQQGLGGLDNSAVVRAIATMPPKGNLS
jgi:3-hydroxyisobutyrate dehydrogenase-like beta-hydroxyacid dehydrogenase